jgi:hypothetical protein
MNNTDIKLLADAIIMMCFLSEELFAKFIEEGKKLKHE